MLNTITVFLWYMQLFLLGSMHPTLLSLAVFPMTQLCYEWFSCSYIIRRDTLLFSYMRLCVVPRSAQKMCIEQMLVATWPQTIWVSLQYELQVKRISVMDPSFTLPDVIMSTHPQGDKYRQGSPIEYRTQSIQAIEMRCAKYIITRVKSMSHYISVLNNVCFIDCWVTSLTEMKMNTFKHTE